MPINSRMFDCKNATQTQNPQHITNQMEASRQNSQCK